MPMPTCKELTELVTDYLEGRLPFGDNMQLHLHLMMCKDCRAYVMQMQTTLKTLGRLPAEPMPDAVRERLLAHFRRTRGAGRPEGG